MAETIISETPVVETMVDRMARAIKAVRYLDACEFIRKRNREFEAANPEAEPVDKITEGLQITDEWVRRQCLTALDAMLNPTLRMITAGSWLDSDEIALEVWGAMIRDAIKESGRG